MTENKDKFKFQIQLFSNNMMRAYISRAVMVRLNENIQIAGFIINNANSQAGAWQTRLIRISSSFTKCDFPRYSPLGLCRIKVYNKQLETL